MSDEKGVALEGLRKVWPDGTAALDGVSLSVPLGEIVAILGGSGAGKSTLLRCAARLIEPTSGTVHVGGVEVTAARGRALARARARVGFVFQQFNLVPGYTALENVLLARIAHAPWWRGTLGLFSPEDHARAQRELEAVGLGDKLHAKARDLSGGQQQRVAVARAFAQEPAALFADEPTASLDPKLAEAVLGLLQRYGRERNVPVLMNVHSLELARTYADRVVGLRRGRVVFDGPVASFDAAAVEQIYAGVDDHEGGTK